MVHIHAGPVKDKFFKHKHLRLEASTRIKSAFEAEDSKESETGIVQLFDEDANTFSFAVDWMYQGMGKKFEGLNWIDEHPPVSTYLKLWILGNNQGMNTLKKFVMEQLHA